MRGTAGKVISIIVAVLLAAVLAFLLYKDHQATEKLKAENQVKADKMAASVKESKAEGQAIYEQLMASLGGGSYGFICFGDSNMVGNKKGTLADSLQAQINKALFADFERDLFKATGFDSFKEMEFSVVNMGVTDEGMNEIKARSGAQQVMLGEDFTMPAEFDRVNVSLIDPNGTQLLFAPQKYASFGTVTIDGVPGALYEGEGMYDDIHPILAFERETAGESWYIPAWTPIEIESTNAYRNYYPVIFMSPDPEMDPVTFVDNLWQILSLYGNGEGHYAVIITTEEGSDYDLACAESFGAHYIRNSLAVGSMAAEDYDDLASQVYEKFQASGLFTNLQAVIEQTRATIGVTETTTEE